MFPHRALALLARAASLFRLLRKSLAARRRTFDEDLIDDALLDRGVGREVVIPVEHLS